MNGDDGDSVYGDGEEPATGAAPTLSGSGMVGVGGLRGGVAGMSPGHWGPLSFDHYIAVSGGDTSGPATVLRGSALLLLCDDLGVEVDSVQFLLLAWTIRCASSLSITRAEWNELVNERSVTSLEEMKDVVASLKVPSRDSDCDEFRSFYEFCFFFCLNSSSRCLDYKMALYLWPLLLPPSVRLEAFCRYVENEARRPITRDEWRQLLPFVSLPSLSDYDSHFPILMDEFVEYARAQGMSL